MGRKVRDVERAVVQYFKDSISDENKYRITKAKLTIFFTEAAYDFIDKAAFYYETNLKQKNVALFKYQNVSYMFVTEELYTDHVFPSSNELDKNNASDTSVYSAIAMLAISKNLLHIRDSLTEMNVIDGVLGWEDEHQFKCEELYCLLNDFHVIRLDDNIINIQYREDIARLLALWLNGKRNSKWSEESSSSIQTLLLLDSSRSVTEIILNLFQTSNEKLIFLQLYRCIEYLFNINRAILLAKSYNLSVENMLELVCGERGFRYAESQSLNEILGNYCSETLISGYYNFWVYAKLCV